MYVMMWLVAFVHAQSGPQVVPVGETTKFQNEAECMAFGQAMSTRMMDYTRGGAGLDWNDPVSVHYRCTPAGVKS